MARATLAGLICTLSLCAGAKRQPQHYVPFTTAAGYVETVADSKGVRTVTKTGMREFAGYDRERHPIPYSMEHPHEIYGTRPVGPGRYIFIRAYYDKEGRAGCIWSSSGIIGKGIDVCAEEQVRNYSEELDEAIGDVVR